MNCISIVVVLYTLAAAPAQAAEAVSHLTVRIVPSQTLRLTPQALELTHNSGTDLKITAECNPPPKADSASLLLSLAGKATAQTLCQKGGSAGAQDLYTHLPAGTLSSALAYTTLGAQRDAVAFTVTYTSVEQ